MRRGWWSAGLLEERREDILDTALTMSFPVPINYPGFVIDNVCRCGRSPGSTHEFHGGAARRVVDPAPVGAPTPRALRRHPLLPRLRCEPDTRAVLGDDGVVVRQAVRVADEQPAEYAVFGMQLQVALWRFAPPSSRLIASWIPWVKATELVPRSDEERANIAAFSCFGLTNDAAAREACATGGCNLGGEFWGTEIQHVAHGFDGHD